MFLGKNSTGKEQVFHDSVIHVPESCPSPTKDRIQRLSTIGVKEQKEKPTNGKEADGPKQTASKSRQSTNFVSSSAATSFMTTPESQVKGNREQSEVSESKAMPGDEGTAEAEVRQKDGKEEGNVDIKAEVKGKSEFLDNLVKTAAETQHDTDTTFSKANSGAAAKRMSSLVASTDKAAKSKGKGQKKSTKMRTSYSPEVGREGEVEDRQSASDSLDISHSKDMMSTQGKLEQEDGQEGIQKEEWLPKQTKFDSGILENAIQGEVERAFKDVSDYFACSSLPRDSSKVRPDLEEETLRRYAEVTFDDPLIPLREKREYDAPTPEYLQSKLKQTSWKALTRKVKVGESQRSLKDIADEMEESLVKSKLKPELTLYGKRTQPRTSYLSPSTTQSIKHRVHDTLAHKSSDPIRLSEHDRLRAKTKSPIPGSEESNVLATGLLRNLQPISTPRDYYRPAKVEAPMKKIIRMPSIHETILEEDGFMSFSMGTQPPTTSPTGRGREKYRKNNDPNLEGDDRMTIWKVLGLNSTPTKKPIRMNTLKQRALGTFRHDSLSSSKGESWGKVGDPLSDTARSTVAGVGQASPESYVLEDLILNIRKMQEDQPLPPLKGKFLHNKSTFLSLSDPHQRNTIMEESDAWTLSRILETEEEDRKRSHAPRLPLHKYRGPSLSRNVQIPARKSRLSPTMTSSEESLLCLLCYCNSQRVGEDECQSLLSHEGKLSTSSPLQNTPESCLCSLVPFSAGTFPYYHLGYSLHFAQALCGFDKKKHTPKESSHKSLFGHLYKAPAALRLGDPHRHNLCVKNSALRTNWNYHHAITDPQLIVKHDSDVLPEKEWECSALQHTADDLVRHD